MDPTIIYGRIVEALHHHRDVLVPDLFWESDAAELRKELLSSFTAGRIKDASGTIDDWSPYLSKFEKDNVENYTSLWLKKNESVGDDAVFVLNQSAMEHKTWSSPVGGEPARMPTLLLNCLQFLMFCKCTPPMLLRVRSVLLVYIYTSYTYTSPSIPG